LYIPQRRRQLVLFSIQLVLLSFCHLRLFHPFQLGIDLLFIGEELVSPDVGLEHRVQGGRIVSHDFLLDV
jgi:hypothetical protein